MTDKKNVYECINAVMADLAKQGIGKNQTNTFDEYKFRGIDDVYNALSCVLAKNGLVISMKTIDKSEQERSSNKGSALFYKSIHVEYKLTSMYDQTSEFVQVIGEAMDRGDKAFNKAYSAAYKLMAFQVFCIPIDGQDSENESHEVQDIVISEKQVKNIINLYAEAAPDATQFHNLYKTGGDIRNIKQSQYHDVVAKLSAKIQRNKEASDDNS